MSTSQMMAPASLSLESLDKSPDTEQVPAFSVDSGDQTSRTRINQLPGKWGLPLVGETLKCMKNPLKYFGSLFVKHGPVFRANLMGSKMVVIGDPEVVAFLLRKEGKLVEANWPKATQRLTGKDSIIVVTGRTHDEYRKIMNPSFSPDNMQKALPSIVECSRKSLESWVKTGIPDLAIACRNFTFDVALRVLFGSKNISEKESLELQELFSVFADGLFVVPLDFPGTQYNAALKARKTLDKKLLSKVQQLREAQEDREEGAIDDNSEFDTVMQTLVSVVRDDGSTFTDNEILDILVVVLFAGYDTTSSLLGTMLLTMYKRSDIMQKLQAEQDAIREKYGDKITVETIKEMKYLDAFIYECLQYIPIGANQFRIAKEDFVIPGHNLLVKKGEKVTLSNLGAQYASNYEDILSSTKTKVEKFIDPNATLERIQKGLPADKVWHGFGLGKRKCLGKALADMESRVFAAMLIRDYDYTMSTKKLSLYNSWSYYPFPGPKKVSMTVSKK